VPGERLSHRVGELQQGGGTEVGLRVGCVGMGGVIGGVDGCGIRQ
jgi:hypothetical protein